MAESLASAQVLGGIAVTISGDTAQLRAAVADAKATCAAAEKTIAVKVPVTLRMDQAASGIGQLRALCDAASNTLKITIPVQFAQQAMPALPGTGSGIPTVSQPPLGLPGPPQRLALPAPGQTAFDRASGNYGTRGGFQSAEYGSAGAYSGIAPGPMEGPQNIGLLGRMARGFGNARAALNEGSSNPAAAFHLARRAFIPLMVADAGISTLQAAGGVGKAIGQMNAGASEDEIAQTREGVRNDIRSIPVLGGTIDKVGNTLGSVGNYLYSSSKNLILGNGFHSDYQLAAKTKEAAAKEDQQTARMKARADELAAQNEAVKPITQAGNLHLSEFGQTATQNAVTEAQENLRLYNEKYGSKGGTADVQEARDTLGKLVAQAVREDRIAVNSENRQAGAQLIAAAGGTQAASLSQQSIAAYRAGDNEQSAVKAREAERAQLVGQQGGNVATAQNELKTLQEQGADPNRIANASLKVAAIQKQNAKELAAFDEKTQADAEDRKRKKAIDTQTTIDAKKEASLRIAHKFYDADLAAFDSSAKAKLDAITDVTEKQNEATRLASQRQVIVAQQQEQIALHTSAIQTEARSATLRANHEANKADLADFDETTKQILAKTDAKEKKAVQAARAQERAAIVQEQQEQRANLNTSLDTRQAASKAKGNNEGQLAGVIEEIGGFKLELANAQKEDRGKIASTQAAELQSLQKQILQPVSYATEFDASREAAGGPTGDAGKEITDILKVIADYLKTIKDKPGGLAA